MGKVYAGEAHDIFSAWKDICIASTGIGNVYEVDGNRYTLDISRKQHNDGAMTGSVWRLLTTNAETGVSTCQKAGSWRIDADGTVARYPVGLRKLVTV
jgi:hypothetical protein